MRDVSPLTYSQDKHIIFDIQPFLPIEFDNVVPYISLDLLDMGIEGLSEVCKPTSMERAYKILFWKKVALCRGEQRRMTFMEARCGVLSKSGLEKFCDIPGLMCWLLTAEIPIDVLHEVRLQELLNELSILTKPFDSEDTVINFKLIDTQLKLYTLLDKRVNGDFLQKIEEKSMRVNYTKSDTTVPKQLKSDKDRIKELELKIKQAGQSGGSALLKGPSDE